MHFLKVIIITSMSIVGNTVASNMMILWGTPAVMSKSKISTSNWNSCVSKCYNDPYCIVVYSKSKFKTTECYTYRIRGLESIQINTGQVTDGGIVAMKMNITDQCKVDQQSNFPIMGSTPDGNYIANMNNQYGQTELRYKFSSYCDAGWTRFVRIKRPICLKVFGAGLQLRDYAETACSASGAVLAGLENQQESRWVLAQAIPFLPSDSDESYIWLGAQRKAICSKPTYPSGCLPITTRSFQWTDPSVTGTGGMGPWYLPNGPNNAGFNQFCLEFTVRRDQGAKAMTIDDYQCIVTDTKINNMMGYVCAKNVTN